MVLLTCSDQGQARRLPVHGSRPGGPLAELAELVLPTRPGRTDLDPVLIERKPRRLVVAGTDPHLAPGLLRPLRTQRPDVEGAHLPPGRSPATPAWGPPPGPARAPPAAA